MERLDEYLEHLRTFSAERDWDQFHTPENLARSVSIEVGELLECYQWGDDADIEAVNDEIAEIRKKMLNKTDITSVRIARAAPHFFEEPCISGTRGSGTVFFVGCLLNCIYCQNREISHPTGSIGRRVSIPELSEIFLSLQDEEQVHNINLVTAAHVFRPVVRALETARSSGLVIPVVYNSSGYETPETLQAFSGLVNVYLPDLKYLTPALALSLSGKEDYPAVATRALAEMVRQTGEPVFDDAGMMVRGTLVRHLVLPGHTQEAKKVLSYLHETYGDQVYISILRQYTPMPGMTGELARRLTKREYDRVTDYAIFLGITNAYLQEEGTADEAYIPAWDA